MIVNMKKEFVQSLAKLKVQKIFQKNKKKQNKKTAITCMMKFQEFRKPMFISGEFQEFQEFKKEWELWKLFMKLQS